MRKYKIGLVLGGGGARGLAHIGVLKVLQDNGITPDIVVGTSMGAMIGAVFAQHPNADFLEKHFLRFINGDKFRSLGGSRLRKEHIYDPEDILTQLSREIKRRIVINLAAHKKSLLKSERLESAVNELIEPGHIENTQLPYACVAIDLISGEDIVFRKGNIQRAVMASSAIPGFMPPVELDNFQLVDGSVCMNFPVNVARELGADIIVASNVSSIFEVGIRPDNVVDIVMRSHLVASKKINEILLEQADFVISPKIGTVHWSEFEEIENLIMRGKRETERSLDNLKTLIKKRTGIIARIIDFFLNMH